MIKDLVATNLAIAARISISNYCYTECMAYCCRRGYLLLSAKEVSLMKNVLKKDLKIMPLRTKTEKRRYIFNLGANTAGCPNLKDYKCAIHTNPDRPKACQDYPLFMWKNKTIVVTDECPAVKENKLYAYLSEFKAMGYKIIYADKK